MGDREKPNKIIHSQSQRRSFADDLFVISGKCGRIYISTIHTEEDIEYTLKVADQVLTELMA